MLLFVLLIVLLLAALRNRKTGRSPLYSLALIIQYRLRSFARLFPRAARFVERLPGIRLARDHAGGQRAAFESISISVARRVHHRAYRHRHKWPA
jgi:hypothetical protein